ncbi:MAG: hypothetical protein WCL17_05500 [Actinomycetota bacterium]
MKRIAVLLCAGLLLAGCGSIKASVALSNWVLQSNFKSAVGTFASDSAIAANNLRNPKATKADLHTVCAVLYLDAQQANSSLPTPDDQATRLLGKAYNYFSSAANACYDASSLMARPAVLRELAKATATFSEATARVATASTP